MAALQTGTLDGARLEIVDWLELKRQAAEKFRVFLDFGKEFPLIKFSSFSVRRGWAEQHPREVRDFLRALLTAHRRVIANHQLLRDGIVKYLSIDSASAQKLADAYLTLHAWDANGGLTQKDVQYMIEFLTGGGALPAGMKVEDVADLSYLDAMLKEIGRR